MVVHVDGGVMLMVGAEVEIQVEMNIQVMGLTVKVVLVDV
jgi:hypothetical protein